jgi:hypothetical protein
MLTLLLAATLGQYRACPTHTLSAVSAYGYGYAAPAYNYGYAAPQAYFAPVAQYDQYRTELVGDQQRAAQYAAARLQADTALVTAINTAATEISKFRTQVAQATAQPPPQPLPAAPPPLPPPPPVFQQPAPQQPLATPQYPQATPQQPQLPPLPDKTTPPVPGKSPGDFGQVPSIPSDQPPPIPQPQPGFSQPQPGFSQSQPGFNPQPQPPQSSLGGPPSQFQQAAVTILQNRCGKCHTGSGASAGFRIFDAPGQLAVLTQDVRAKIDDVAYSGKIVKVDHSTGAIEELPMPPNGKVFDATEYSTLRAFFNEQRAAIALASQRSGGAR